LLALLLGLLVTVALALTARVVYDHNETRLLRLRGRELDLVLGGLVPTIEAPLASAVQLANLTGGVTSRVKALIGRDVGPHREFSSVSIWSLQGSTAGPVVTVGAAPEAAGSSSRVHAILQAASRRHGLDVLNTLDARRPALAYAYAAPGVSSGYGVYAESPLPRDRRLTVPRGDGLAGLHYALYLGRTRARSSLLLSDLTRPATSSESASFTVPFGGSALTLLVSPAGSLGGSFFDDLPWIIAAAGLLVTLAAALMTDRLVRRRRYAEGLAGTLERVAQENRDLYTEQRSIAQTLQHALLPEALPQLDGLRSCARYVPAVAEIDVGGDWYDLVSTGPQQALFVIGDVSGHGLDAATTMAALRHAVLAYANQDPSPAAVLTRLADFVNSNEHSYFATVLCGLIDIGEHRIALASAGHPAPLLLDGSGARFPELQVGVPIGVAGADDGYSQTRIATSSETMLIAYTDGLVERRGESLDVGLARLRDVALDAGADLDVLVERLARELASQNNDDTAILGVRWVS
jgi:serine phosphatase RsbU (regulator of sigma subunit)